MIPEAGTRQEFKDVALRVCSKMPLTGEVYDCQVRDSDDVRTIGKVIIVTVTKQLGSHAVYFARDDCKFLYIEYKKWQEFVDSGHIKFIGFYDPRDWASGRLS